RDERFGDGGHDRGRGDLARCAGSRGARRGAELFEREDNVDDGAEEPDEWRVVAERSEVREACFEQLSLGRGRALHPFFGGGWAARSEPEPRARDGGADRAQRPERLERGGNGAV